MTAPLAGSVLGIDVGFSTLRRSSAACRLDWDADGIDWTIRRFRALPAERTAAIAQAVDGRRLLAAALDGPLCPGLQPATRYRRAEQMLTIRLAARIGKPGAPNAPGGRKLNAAANACAQAVLATADLAPARHACAIDARALLEAFPGGFLGVMLAEPAALTVSRATRSDRFYAFLCGDATLPRLIGHLLPGRSLRQAPGGVVDHDERAALACALAALGVVANDFTAVGDAEGWIILPPWSFIQPWAQRALRENAGTTGRLYRSGRDG